MNTRLSIKICGITNRDDALAAIDAGAGALGFNLYPGSKRHVLVDEIAPWLRSLPGEALRVALMVNPAIEEIRRVQPLFDAIQLHGSESPALCAAAAATGIIWKAFPLAPGLDPSFVAAFPAKAIIIDSAGPSFGGSGHLIDLDFAATFVRGCQGRPVWLSGGLNPSNVAAAIAKVRPFGVDVATGVELPGNPRRKDHGLIRSFIAVAQGA